MRGASLLTTFAWAGTLHEKTNKLFLKRKRYPSELRIALQNDTQIEFLFDSSGILFESDFVKQVKISFKLFKAVKIDVVINFINLNEYYLYYSPYI